MAVLILVFCHSQSFLLDFSAEAVAYSDACVQRGIGSTCCTLRDHFPIALPQGPDGKLVPNHMCR